MTAAENKQKQRSRFRKHYQHWYHGLIQEATHEAEKVVNEAQSGGAKAAVNYVATKSKQIVLTSLVKIWSGLNHYPPFHAVAEMAVPTTARWSEKYNHVVKDITRKGYTVFGYLPLIPIDEIAKAFKQGEVNVSADHETSSGEDFSD
ncbi:REF/SRPP-like protein At1g67360 [Medicago truncatula]|uniref:Rubber elongation factor protein n=1 Tax=Medicago truncatula TaxID=3880 RepID=A0A072VK99_MEDTR|nr:REF/SRPP-like protein At1g67360 [Medicago truncatula]KEH41843.1 rubber elongation factor protein [Medicago truncatula]